jgi:hypothetical protein
MIYQNKKRGAMQGDVIDNLYQSSIGHNGTGVIDNGTIMARLRSTVVWLAILQQFAEPPLQLFFSFCLNLKLVALFSISVLLLLFDEFGSVLFVLYAAAVCTLLIAIVAVSAAVMAASIATISRFFFVVVVWFIRISHLTQLLLYLY